MVGKIQDIVSASIVAGAAERVSDASSGWREADSSQTSQVTRIDDVKKLSNYNQTDEQEDPLAEREEREPMDEKSVS